jgi:Asp-tRNA(Asn)/Glu-tRNA(Gln) amidotransferase A subunit family amidase
VTKYLQRIHTYDTKGPCLNSIIVSNPAVYDEAAASDQRRKAGELRGPLDGIPYTLKASMKYKGMPCTSGSPALDGLIANEDSYVGAQLRQAGAVLVGLTNTPPMMASGMHRGLYGRAESPYNLEYLTAAFSSGSSNGSATSTAASFAAFGLGSETVSSGRSPASNNGLVAYTPSRTVISPRGVWPLYPTCDVLVPHTRTVKDMLVILDYLTAEDSTTVGDFWREQKFVAIPKIPRPASFLQLLHGASSSLAGKWIAVPKMYIGEKDQKAKPIQVSPEVIELWHRARKDLEALGGIVIETGFPLVTNYEDESVTGEANNVVGFKPSWNGKERGELVAYLWDDFLKENGDARYPGLASVDGTKLFPRPEGYLPDKYAEHKNFMNYPGLVETAKKRNGKSIWDIDGIAEALPALEAQRKRDLEDWMDTAGVDLVVFPANGDVGRADLENNEQSARHALQNGVKYSNGNRAIRHMGVPTVSVTMGLMEQSRMPVNLTFAGKHGQDSELLRYAYAFEQQSKRRVAPPVTPPLDSDIIKVC